jgi:Tetrahydromethanopterin S-methyltransferase, subunit A
MPAQAHPERARAVALMRRLDCARELLLGRPLRRSVRRLAGRDDWPVTSGAYVLGDPAAPVAVCTLTDRQLMRPAAALPAVAIAGGVHTANLAWRRSSST